MNDRVAAGLILLCSCWSALSVMADIVIDITDEVVIDQDDWRWAGISIGGTRHSAKSYDYSMSGLAFGLDYWRQSHSILWGIEGVYKSDLSGFESDNQYEPPSHPFSDDVEESFNGYSLNGGIAWHFRGLAVGGSYLLRGVKAEAEGSRVRMEGGHLQSDLRINREPFSVRYSALIHGPAVFARVAVPILSRPPIVLNVRAYVVPNSMGYIKNDGKNDIGGNVFLAASGELQWEFRPGVAMYIRGDYEDLLNEEDYSSRIFSLGVRRQL